MTRLARILVCACLGLTTIAGCGSAKTGAARPAHSAQDLPDPGPIRPPSALPFDFQWRQHVTATWPEGSQGFEAVLMHHEGRLQLVGLSPMGQPGFILTLNADATLDFENRTDESLPFPPEHILADVERVFFPWLPTPAPGFHGARSGEAHGLEIHERWQQGRLAERRFTWADAPERGSVAIDYEGWIPGQDAPERVVLTSDWFDYTLTIETLEQSRLSPEP